jgi:DNA-binding transcriptional ArsR family regulator
VPLASRGGDMVRTGVRCQPSRTFHVEQGLEFALDLNAGVLSDQFTVSKPTMSAHFAVLKEADLVHAEKAGKLGYIDNDTVTRVVFAGVAATLGYCLSRRSQQKSRPI